jgi:hypothetical protein
MDAEAYLVGGKKERGKLPSKVFSAKVHYDNTGHNWEMHYHLDLGEGWPFVLRAHSDMRDADHIRELVRSWGLAPPPA